MRADGIFRVVVNDEEQYSVWRDGRDLPLGWHEAGFSGPLSACLSYIEANWTDIRPLSMRRAAQ